MHMRGPGGPGGGPGGGRFQTGAVKPKNAKKVLRRLLGYVSHSWRMLLLVLGCVVISTAVTIISPRFIGIAIDGYIQAKRFAQLWRVLFPMAGMYLVGAALSYVQSLLMSRVAQSTVHRLRRDLFDHVQKLPVRYFDNTPYGELMSRLSNDVDNVAMSLSQVVSSVFQSGLSIVGALAMMLVINPLLTLAAMLTVPLSIFLTGFIARRTRAMYKKQQAALGEMNGYIEESISGQRVIKVFAREAQVESDFAGLNEAYRRNATRAQIFSGIIGPLMNMINNLAFVIVAVFGGWFVAQGRMSVGMITSFTQYVRQFTRPINELANQFTSIQSAIAGAERVFEVMDEPAEQDNPGARELADVRGDVCFENVTFGYRKDRPVLQNVSLHADPGVRIALVGPTGAGKTTIVNLLMRFYDIDEGDIRIDGENITAFTKDSLRRKLGIVLQDVHLFAGTVRDNIAYGKLSATDEEVRRAAQTAGADVFIRRLPDGYSTVLTEDATNLSHGQRQLLSIARAVLADPAILILDEATSSVDTRTELVIQRAMLALMKGRTAFVIAHRLSTIRDAECILVINDGRIIEQGTHEQLLEQQGFYEQLYNAQFRRQERLMRQAQEQHIIA